jgi:hypothetical protein
LCLAVLLNPCAATLDQNNQHDDKQNAGNGADKGSAVHGESLSINDSFEVLSGFAGSGFVSRRSGTLSVRNDGARQRSSCGSRERRRAASKKKLVDLGATTLNQNNQHDDEEQARHDTNQSGAIHGESSFFAASLRHIRKLVSDLAMLGSS